MNRTNEYAADATGFSTGDTVMTAWVVTVLFTPQTMPERMTRTIRAGLFSVQIAMPSVISANRPRLAYIVFAMPNRACSRGAPNTANSATKMPQPKNTKPSLIGDSSIGNGAYPRMVKKPQL